MERVNEETPKYLTTRTIQVMYMSNFNTIARYWNSKLSKQYTKRAQDELIKTALSIEI